MAQLKFLIIFIILHLVIQQTFQQQCRKDVNKLREEDRRCGNPCSQSRPCRNKRARCLCDGACGFVCIPPDHRCVAPDSIRDGSISVDSYSFMSVIRYSCDEGFELIGPEERTCRSDSRWSGKEPFCAKSGVRCGRPQFEFYKALLDAWPVKEEYFEGDQLSYQCAAGFNPARGDVLDTTCVVEDGVASWTPVHISCSPESCPKPENIQNGYYEGEEFSFGQKVEYYCNPGYLLYGIETLVCYVDGWSNPAPRCEPVTCETPDDIPNGRVTFSQPLKYRSNVRYDCNAGFVLKGDQLRQCNEVGEWSGTQPTCSKADCGTPEAPANGRIISFSGSAVNDRVEYQCGPRTTTNSIMSAVCTVVGDTAKWSVPPPICLRDCEVVLLENADVTHNWRNINVGSYLHHGTSVHFKCRTGFEIPSSALESEDAIEVKCDDGAWSNSITCKAARCFKSAIQKWRLDDRNLQIPNDMLNTVDSGTRISLDCHPNYQEKEGNIFLLCDHGSWRYPRQPKERCSKRSCDIRHVSFAFTRVLIDGKGIQPQRIGKVADGTRLKFECTEADYELYRGNTFAQTIDDQSIKCEDGELTTASFDCREGRCKCSDLKIRLYGKGMELVADCVGDYVESGSKQKLRCSVGYGNPPQRLEASCNRKKWTVTGQCKRKCSCDTLHLETSVVIYGTCRKDVDSGNTFFLKCAEGYDGFVDDRIVECKEGTWNVPRNAFCYARCITPYIVNGIVETEGRRNDFTVVQPNTEVGHGVNIYVSCNEGYRLNPRSPSTKQKITCSDGLFDDSYQCLRIHEETTTQKNRPITNPPKTSSIYDNPETTTRKSLQTPATKENRPYTTKSSFSLSTVIENENTETTPMPQKLECSYETKDQNLMAYKDGQLVKEFKIFSDGDKLEFRCSDITLHSLIGSNYLECGKNGWKGTIPTCLVLSHRDRLKPPVVTYTLDKRDDSYIASNGSLFIPENSYLTLDCWWFHNRYGPVVWSWNGQLIRHEFYTQWIGDGNYELHINEMKEWAEGLYLCINPEGKSHGIDVRVIRREEETPEETTTTSTTRETTTKTTTSEIPTTTEDLPPLFSCRAMDYDNLDIFENGRLLQDKKKYFDTATSLVFRCYDQQGQKLMGSNKIQCDNGKWSPTWPNCRNIVRNDWQSPPPITVSSAYDVKYLENGDYLIRRGEEINFICGFFYAKPFMLINGKEVTNNRNTKIEYSSFHGWYVRMQPVYTAATYTFKCYIPWNKKFEKYANSLTVRVGDSCELNEDDVRKRYQNAVFLKSTLRPLYAEGDKVLFGCEKLGVDVFLPFALMCGRDGVWDIIREPQMNCS